MASRSCTRPVRSIARRLPVARPTSLVLRHERDAGEILVQRRVPVENRRPERTHHALLRLLTHAAEQRLVLREESKAHCQLTDIAGLHEEARLPVLDHCGDAADAARHHRRSARHRLEDREWRCLGDRWEDQQISARVVAAQLRLLQVSGEVDAIRNAQLHSELPDPVLGWAVTHEDAGDSRRFTECAKQQVRGLAEIETAHEQAIAANTQLLR